ncbi:methionine--tRNA ligase [Candidatus Roizmanbacteria bacterium CG_4_10_14_0_8_um_filter_33_9]|uniref:Methionine--tRNA ligase n=1 Tax=Candidatus Roizmanbacteria bacterium CG_4_10_14_0_8_um_filter_33_9 TaxID=1974826 RepID=A0A2M7QI41_9BACT|nr:MAG: methionine--tRNA ligase [Candidatus Roizmanbacteria bacterium CG_4_10_14_0_8_um_filter_33_9]
MKKPNCTFADFLKLDFRVGEIKQATPLPNSSKLLLLSLDLGDDYGVVEILSGIAKYISPQELVGKKVPVLANLEPKPMAGKISNGFILMADLIHHVPALIFLSPDIPNGTNLC